MPYRVWEEKLRQLLILWYKTYEDAEKNAKKVKNHFYCYYYKCVIWNLESC